MAALYAAKPAWKKFPTNEADKLSTLYSWFVECNSDHHECAITGIKPPTRLIQVAARNRSNPKLVETSKLNPSNVPYCTLSYRWGKRGQPKTKKDTVDEHLKGIDYESLPQTHKDALAICSYLRIEYLWIDALCIIQDTDDWELEAARMKDIYSGSVLTIAANDALDCYGGFFADVASTTPDEDAARQRSFFEVSKPGDDPKMLIQLEDRGYPQRSALAERGWTLQETILSNRVVLVKNSELTWRCRRHLRTETGLQTKLPPNHLKCEPLIVPIHLSELQTTDKPWWSWMEDYSARNFTRPLQDRLAALAGLVDYYAQHSQHSNDTPLLGLWTGTLEEDLQWMRTGSLPEKNGQILENIPTWSWLWCRGRVMFEPWFYGPSQTSIIRNHIKVIHKSVEWAGKPFISQVKSSMLIVEAPMKELYIGRDEGKNIFVGEVGVTEWTESSSSDATFILDNEHDDEYLFKTYPCMLARSQSSELNRKECVNVFIIFQQVPESTEGNTYRRIGIGSYTESAFSFDLNARRTIHWT
jgi:hypothetical protein